MAGITSSIGLATGLDITNTVNQLLAIQARPREALATRTTTIDSQRTALTTLTAQLISVQLTVKRFNSNVLYDQRVVASSDQSIIAATSTGTPSIGDYQFTSLRLAKAQQFQSSQFTSSTSPIGAGTLKFRYGGFVNPGQGLDTLNSGTGFSRGKIKITDRSGDSSEIDLTTARNVDDVLEAINSNATIDVNATTVNGKIRLTDSSGQTISNLKVEEVNNGSTAASLGISGINVAANSVDGSAISQLFGDITLAQLNDGRGVSVSEALSDFRIHFRDGTRSIIDLNKLATTGTKATGTTTAANGTNAQIKFTAKTAGPDGGGWAISFVDDPGVTAGSETVDVDENLKTLVFHIDAGVTTANQVLSALGNDTEAVALFSASLADSSNGTGLVSVADTATTAGPKATLTTIGSDSPNAKLLFTAVQPGSALDDVYIEFIDDNSITGGNETVVFDDSNPAQKKLTFRIDQGNTTANDIVNALNNDPTASQYFTVANVEGSTGNGKVVPGDNQYTSGGALIAESAKIKQLTLQDVVSLINTQAAGKVTASISNNRLQLTDTTVDGGFTFSVEKLNGSTAADDLGITNTASGASITGDRIYSGLKTTLLSSLNGGAGLGTLGTVNLTSRDGDTQSINLSAAETIDDALELLNANTIDLKFSYNSARNGLTVTDSSGGTSSNLIVADGDANNTATKLGLAVNVAATTKSGTDLKLQTVSRATLTSSLNGGKGIANGTVSVTDNNGQTRTLTINDNTKTVGDVIDSINNLGLAITARVNDSGDGILLIDTTTGGGNLLKVTEGSSTTGRDLNLLVDATTQTINAVPKKVIDGSFTYKITLDADDTLTDLASKINAATSNVRATVFNDGTGIKPFRFNLFNQVSGSAGQLLIDTSEVNFSLNQTVAAQDALLQIGSGSSGVLVSSATNTFKGILPDITLTLKSTSATAVNVSTTQSNAGFVDAVKSLVTVYNTFRDRLRNLTAYNADTNQSAVLQGDSSALRVETDLNRLVSGRFFGAGPIQTLKQIGIEFDDKGNMKLDESVLQAKLNESPDDMKAFFNTKDAGMAAKFDNLIEQMAGVGNSLLVGRAAALTRKFESNSLRIAAMDQRLLRQKERLTLQFTNLEQVISKIQANQSAVNQITNIAAAWKST